jgi:F-type H+-transporting ATPase subunit c
MVSLFVLLADLAIGKLAAGLGAGLAALAAGIGIGKVGAAAMEAIARQPEASADIRSNLIVVSAFIEGVAFVALIVCFLLAIL